MAERFHNRNVCCICQPQVALLSGTKCVLNLKRFKQVVLGEGIGPCQGFGSNTRQPQTAVTVCQGQVGQKEGPRGEQRQETASKRAQPHSTCERAATTSRAEVIVIIIHICKSLAVFSPRDFRRQTLSAALSWTGARRNFQPQRRRCCCCRCSRRHLGSTAHRRRRREAHCQAGYRCSLHV